MVFTMYSLLFENKIYLLPGSISEYIFIDKIAIVAGGKQDLKNT